MRAPEKRRLIPSSFTLHPHASAGFGVWGMEPVELALDPKEQYNRNWVALKNNPRGFNVFQEPVYEPGDHPENFIDYECAFAAFHIQRAKPQRILDIGSYRHFLLGLLAYYPVTSIDVRARKNTLRKEIILTCDAKNLTIPDDSFDLVLSLCALEHFGLGRYGDAFDPDADGKAFSEMMRVLKPGGLLLFTTTITRAVPSVAFNAHRIYTYPMLETFCSGLKCVEERFYSHEKIGFCTLQEVTDKPQGWDVYLGCWEKK